MTSEEQIEETLYEAHAYGIRNEVMSEAVKMMVLKPKMDRPQAYEYALKKLLIENDQRRKENHNL